MFDKISLNKSLVATFGDSLVNSNLLSAKPTEKGTVTAGIRTTGRVLVSGVLAIVAAAESIATYVFLGLAAVWNYILPNHGLSNQRMLDLVERARDGLSYTVKSSLLIGSEFGDAQAMEKRRVIADQHLMAFSIKVANKFGIDLTPPAPKLNPIQAAAAAASAPAATLSPAVPAPSAPVADPVPAPAAPGVGAAAAAATTPTAPSAPAADPAPAPAAPGVGAAAAAVTTPTVTPLPAPGVGSKVRSVFEYLYNNVRMSPKAVKPLLVTGLIVGTAVGVYRNLPA